MRDLRATHHASSSKDGVVYRIGRYASIATIEGNFNDSQIVDVLKVITNGRLGVLGTRVADDQVPSGSDTNLVRDMTR